MPLFSIIIPTFNAASTIVTALKSIISQTCKDFEVLIMDGCSKDNTVELVRDINDKRIKVFSASDEGVYDAMNKGIALANGEWLFFLGSDDSFYNSEVLNDLLEIIRSLPADIIYGNVLLKNQQKIYDGEFTIEKLLFERNICHQAIIYKRTVFNKVGLYNLKYKQLADWDFNIRCFKNTSLRIHYTEKVIANYEEMGGMSAKFFDETFMREIPCYYLPQLKRLYLLEGELFTLKSSKAYRLGKFVLSPFVKVRNLMKF